MALNKRNHNPFAKQDEFLYMIIDATTLENIHVVKVGSMRRVQLLGQLLAAEGKTVMAPPVEARGFSKLSESQVQYLYWNTLKVSPEGIPYGAMIQNLVNAVNMIEPTDEHIPTLEYLASQLEPGVVKPVVDPDAPKAAPARPKGTTTTGIIWAICDESLADLHQGVMPTDFKALRAEAWKRCDAEGFNSGTFGVQYGKWKASKLAVPA